MILNANISVEDSGAYIEVWTRDGKPGARMNFFDGDSHRKLEELRRFSKALDEAIALVEKAEKDLGQTDQ